MQIFLCFALFVIGFFYASVGHGGASGYLAVMSFFHFHPAEMSTTALILNALVSAVSFFSYKTAGHFKIQLLIPFLISSVPAAFLGGTLQVRAHFYRYLLASVLIYAAIWLNLNSKSEELSEPIKGQKHFFWISLFVGTVIGLISGIVGIGGGIFLSAYLLRLHLSTTKESAAVSAPFILINSLSGLLGRYWKGRLVLGNFLFYLISAFAGGLSGSYLGARHFSVPLLRKILALVLLLASFKLFLTE